MRRDPERGAAAVEFALILPVLLVLVLGMFEFSRAFHTQIAVTNAAREGARVMAIHDDPAKASSAAIAAAPTLDPAIGAGQVSISPASCAANPGGTVSFAISYDLALMTGFFGVSIPIHGVGVMLCGG
ncbi:TadE family protein [uncultured Schumannella sp.]|uniref:TadE family protein n=1 Tax=uncultured Schumannella sp. TaxID=1195956 RepID=UPI0025D6E618|nr:TadE family protein [uncultured Schumannella sp.]